MLKTSESYIVGIDISTDDEYMATINRIDGMLIKPVAVVKGENAKTIYDIINKGE